MAKKSLEMDNLLSGLVGEGGKTSKKDAGRESSGKDIPSPVKESSGKQKGRKKGALCTTLDIELIEKIHGVLAFCHEHAEDKKITDVVSAALVKYFDAWEKKYGPIQIPKKKKENVNLLDI